VILSLHQDRGEAVLRELTARIIMNRGDFDEVAVVDDRDWEIASHTLPPKAPTVEAADRALITLGYRRTGRWSRIPSAAGGYVTTVVANL
jgi:hypothetical protein